MKQLKKIMAILLAAILLTLMLTACGREQEASGVCTVVIGGESETVYEVNLDKVEIKEGLISVLEYLKTEKGLTYKTTDGGYGAYLTEVGEVKEDGANGVYIYIYTSVEKDFDVSAYATTKAYKKTLLTSAGVGASQLTIENGAIFYIGTVQY